jgi:hypothetical protein
VTDILESQLRKTLAGTHIVERELPGGGLSRLFLGSELRFQRQVPSFQSVIVLKD